MHMNFKARNVTTRSEELFFAELALNKDVFDTNSGYSATACNIVDGNCVGMLLSFSLFVYTHIAVLDQNSKKVHCFFSSFLSACISKQSEVVFPYILLII